MQHHPTPPPPTGDPVPRLLRHWLHPLRAGFTAPSWEHVLVLVRGPRQPTSSHASSGAGSSRSPSSEPRAQLGVESQRQWSDKAIARTTPALLGLYSLISLWACDLLNSYSTPYAAAWYRKTSLTFSDAIGAVRLALWVGDISQHSPPDRKHQKIPPDRIMHMAEALCFAA